MILLTGNIGPLINAVVIIAVLIILFITPILWLMISETKFYKEHYKNTTTLNKILFVIGLFAIITVIFIFVAWTTFKLIIS